IFCPRQRGHDIELRQGGCELGGEPASQLNLDAAGHAQQPQPKPQLLLGAGFGPARPTLAAHVSPPDTDIAWPLIACAEALNKNRTVPATSSGCTKRPCGLKRLSSPLASAGERPVLATMLA